MAYQKVDTTVSSTTWKFQDSPQKEFEGIFLGKRTGIGPNNSSLYDFEYIGEGKAFKQHETVSIWSTSLLDRAFTNLVAGNKVKLNYLGKQKGQKGNQYHAFSIEVDKD